MRRLVCLVAFLSLASSASVVILSNAPSISHSRWFYRLALALSTRHQVTLVDTVEREKVANVTTYYLTGAYDWHDEMTQAEATPHTTYLAEEAASTSPTKGYDLIAQIFSQLCRKQLASDVIQKLINDFNGKKVDLFVMDFSCQSAAALVPLLGSPPWVMACPYSDTMPVLALAGLYDNPSYVPTELTPYTSRMTFTEKLSNLGYYIYHWLIYRWWVLPEEEATARETVGLTQPLDQLLSTVSMVMVNTHPVMDGSKPLPPNVIPMAGFHIDPVKSLPKEIKKFLDESKEGVVYFNLGSNIKSSAMSVARRNMFIEAFRGLPYRVLWKLEVDQPPKQLPPNVMIAKWLPQNDILAHEKVVCFISHGGLLGSQEAVHHGVPIIGMPFMFDQFEVVTRLQRQGVAIYLDYNALSSEAIKETIRAATNPKMKERMKKWSQLFRDRPHSPRETVLFWLEYLIRNPDVKFLQSESVNLYWYQLLMLDVVAFIIFITASFLLTLNWLCRSLVTSPKAKVKKN